MDVQNVAAPRPAGRGSRRGWGRAAAGTAIVLAVLAVPGCGDSGDSGDQTSTTTAGEAGSAPSTSVPSKVPGAGGADVVVDGTGNRILAVTNPSGAGAPYVLRVTNRGPGRFVSVEGLTSDGTAAGYATKASGTPGAQVFDAFSPTSSRYGTTAELKVEAETPETSWEVRLVALRNLPTWDPASPLSGIGDTVVQVPAGTPTATDVTSTVSPADRPLRWTFYRPGPGDHLDKAGDATDAGQAVVPSGTVLVSVQGSMGDPYDWTLTPAP